MPEDAGGDGGFSNFNPKTPRSILAAKRCGFTIKELREKPISAFVDKKQRNKGLRNQLAAIKYKHWENRRKEKMAEVIKERTRMIEFEMSMGSNFDPDAYEKASDSPTHHSAPSGLASARSPSPKMQRWLTVRELLKDKRKEMGSFFKNADVQDSGKLSRDDFVNGLTGLQLGLSPAQIQLCARKFDRGKTGFVDWRLFMEKLVAKIPFIDPPAGSMSARSDGAMTSRSSAEADKSAMIKREEKRLKLIKARQKRELQSVLEFEKEMSRKFEEAAKRAEAERIAVEQRNIERKQRLMRQAEKKRDLQVKKAEELERERLEAQARARRDFAQRAEERERMARKLRVRELARRKKAEAERVKKIEMQRAKERAYQEEQEMLTKKIEAMELKNKIRQERMVQQNKERRLVLMQKREKADLRIHRALERDRVRQEGVRRAYREKQAEATVKREAKEVVEAEEREKRRLALIDKARYRQMKFEEAKKREAMRIDKILDKKARKLEVMQEMYERRDQERQRKNLVRHLKLQDKLDNVERNRRLELYDRQKLGAKLHRQADRTETMLRQKKELLAARIKSGQDLWKKKEDLCKKIDDLRMRKDWAGLDRLMGNMGNAEEEDEDDDRY
jgi:hypothetical protein